MIPKTGEDFVTRLKTPGTVMEDGLRLVQHGDDRSVTSPPNEHYGPSPPETCSARKKTRYLTSSRSPTTAETCSRQSSPVLTASEGGDFDEDPSSENEDAYHLQSPTLFNSNNDSSILIHSL